MKDLQFERFCSEFNIVDNALNMRQLTRWNGRDLVQRENLSEHTHLVVACAIFLIEKLRNYYGIRISPKSELAIIKAAMIHDALEILRGDILSITKDKIPGLREKIEEEEAIFMNLHANYTLSRDEKDIIRLADLMACYKFLERELRYPNNDFCKEAYISCKEKFDNALDAFLIGQGCSIDKDVSKYNPFIKGYQEDAGVDIILNQDVTFLPVSTATINLNVKITPNEGTMAFLCARTSAAAKGLVVATCPIDPNYTGDVTAIVHNVSNDIVTYKKGESFCQYVTVKILHPDVKIPVKKAGKRSQSKLGGTDT